MSPKLYLIPTPIGNLEDITLRAIRILKEVDLILAEDTRTAGILLNHYGIKKKKLSHHKFNEHRMVVSITSRLLAGETMALVSDAGTPGISDPGFLLVRQCLEKGIEVECLPGATAFVPALVNSGLPMDRFCFEGFLPIKKGRLSRIKDFADESRSIILYESRFRVVATLIQLAHVLGYDRKVSVSRELTKLHEETIRGTLAEVITRLSQTEIKGEFVIVVAGKR